VALDVLRFGFEVVEEEEKRRHVPFWEYFIENRGAGRRGEAMSCRCNIFWFIR
jgi:hypothetical protein